MPLLAINLFGAYFLSLTPEFVAPKCPFICSVDLGFPALIDERSMVLGIFAIYNSWQLARHLSISIVHAKRVTYGKE